MTHQVGDRVKVNCVGSELHGNEVIVTSALMTGKLRDVNDNIVVCSHHTIDELNCYGVSMAFEPHELIPIYDGHEKTTWDECVFQPKELVT